MKLNTEQVKNTCDIARELLKDFSGDFAAMEDVVLDDTMDPVVKETVIKQYVDRNHERLASLYMNLERIQQELVGAAQKIVKSKP